MKVNPSGCQRVINQHFLIPFCREIFTWTKLALKKQLGSQKSKNRGKHHFWSSHTFFKRFILIERYIQAVSKEPSTNILWSLLVEKNSFQQILPWESGSDFKKAKLEGRTISEVINFFSSSLFKMKVYPSGFQRVINQLFLIPFRREIFTWTKLALKKRLGFQNGKKRGEHHFRSSQFFVNRSF